MDFKVRISEAALTDFEEILAYSWANFPDTAERFGSALLNHVGPIEAISIHWSPIEHRLRAFCLGKDPWSDPRLAISGPRYLKMPLTWH